MNLGRGSSAFFTYIRVFLDIGIGLSLLLPVAKYQAMVPVISVFSIFMPHCAESLGIG